MLEPGLLSDDLERRVGVEDLFFSTTDARGVIGLCNSVFIRISGHPRERLSGAPHNIVRHQEMPGGAFRVMWDALLGRRPFAGYVRNLAADGRRYDVLATVMPLPDGSFLSVRTAPMHQDLFATVLGAYGAAREVEVTRRADGVGARQAALGGAESLGSSLNQLGYADYEAFQNVLLPLEVARREELSGGLPERPGHTGRLGDALRSTHELHRALDVWMAQQDTLVELSTSLRETGAHLAEETAQVPVDEATLNSLAASGGTAAMLVQPLRMWLMMQGIVRSTVESLLRSLDQLDRTSARMRFLVALARLQATTLATFVTELIDAEGQASDEDWQGAEAAGILVVALRQGLADMRSHATRHRALAEETAAHIERVASTLAIPRDVLKLFGAGSPPSSWSTEVAELVPLIAESIARAEATLDRLVSLAESCRAAGTQVGEDHLRELLAQIERDLA